MSFGSRLRQKRKEMGLKQSELGELLGVTGSAIGNYESDFSSPKAEILFKVFEVLHCDANYLFQDEMKNPSAPAETEEEKLTKGEHILIDNYRSLNDDGKVAAQDSVEALTYMPKYKKYSDSKNMA